MKRILVRKTDDSTEEQYVVYGAFIGNVFPDGSIVEIVYND